MSPILLYLLLIPATALGTFGLRRSIARYRAERRAAAIQRGNKVLRTETSR